MHSLGCASRLGSALILGCVLKLGWLRPINHIIMGGAQAVQTDKTV
jgi:hypothetical protein